MKKSVIAMCFALFWFNASATSYYVNDASSAGDIYTSAVGNNSNPGTAALPFATLTYALTLAGANDIIYVDAGTYSDKNLSITQSNLSIIGAGSSATIFNNNFASANTNYLMKIFASGVTVTGIMAIKYNTTNVDEGRAVTISGATGVTLQDVILTNNHGSGGGDPALDILANSTVTIKKGSYSCNPSGATNDYGGGIEIKGQNINVTIDSASISNNGKTSFEGGGIYITGDNTTVVTITNCTISNNQSRNGGGLYITLLSGLSSATPGPVVTVKNSCINSNTSQDISAFSYGGGATVFCGTVKFTNCSFSSNSGGKGGAIAANSNDGSVTLTVDSCTFASNATTQANSGKDVYARVAFGHACSVTGTQNTFSGLSSSLVNGNTALMTFSNSGNPSTTGTTGSVTLTNTTNPSWTTVTNCVPIAGSCVCTIPTITSVSSVTSICSGSTFSTSLVSNTASVYTTYNWTSTAVAGITGHSSSGTGNISETLVNSTATPLVVSYSVTPNYNGLCSGTTVVYSVTVNPIPVLTISGTTSICSGTSTTLTGATATNYTWSTGATTNTVTVIPTVTTTYTLTGANGSCIDTKTVSINVTSTPTVNIIGSTTHCSGSAMTLTGSTTAGTFTWSANAGGVSTNTVSVNPGLGNTTYTLNGSVGTCTATTSITVSVTATPTLAVNSPTICSGQSAVLTAATANSYSWSTFETTPTITVSPVNTTTYTVTGDNGAGCTSTKTATVTVNPTPTVVISGAHFICQGTTLILTGATATNYTWLPGGANTPTLSITPSSGSNTYTLIGANGSCTSATTAMVDVAATPTVSVNNATICSGQSTVLTAGGATTFTWSANAGGVTTSTANVNPITTTVYTVAGTLGACKDSITTTVTVNPAPSLSINGAIAICSGQSITLTGGTATNYTWSTGATTANISVSPTTNTTYTLSGTTGTCTASTVATVTVNTPPSIGSASVTSAPCGSATGGCINSVSINGGLPAYQYSWDGGLTWNASSNYCSIPAGTYSLEVKDANGCTTKTNISVPSLSGPAAPAVSPSNTVVCLGDNVPLSISPVGSYTYTWTDATGTHTGATYTITNIGPAGNYNISVTATDAGGCVSTSASLTITVNPLPLISASSSSVSICAGQSAVLNASGAATYTWSMNAAGANTSTVSVTPLSSDIYTVTGTSAGCTASQTVSVNIISLPGVTATATSPTICAGQSTVLTAGGGTTYTWSTTQTTNTISVSPTGNTTYTVIAESGGCTASQTVAVNITPLPIIVATPSSASICTGQSSVITASGATTFTWSSNAGGGTATTVTVNPTSNTTYTLSGTQNGCSDSSTVTITLGTPPTITAAASQTLICSGNTTTLTASGATNYTWLPSGSQSGTITDNPTSNTTYTLIGESSGCTNTLTTSVNVTATPTVSIVP
ncbi:MAG: beta strand repeat-containing protein, partial [Bacteroidia bacterium]